MFYGNFRNNKDVEFLRDAIERFKTMFAGVYAGDNAILFDRSLGFLEDKRFMSAFSSNVQNDQDQSLILRLNTLVWAANHVLPIDGDFVECGVYRGFSSAVIADYLDFGKIKKTYYLYDTFEGIPAEYNSENRDAPEYASALDVLFDRISSGGIVVFDDYGWAAYNAQRLAADQFATQRGYRILEIPTGQGLLIKR